MRESENCSHNCRECGSDCAERREPQSFLEEPNAGTHVKKVIGIVSGKGGVGKSLVTSLLASAMQKKGYRCAVLDADITGPSIPRMFGIRKKAASNETGILPAETKDGMKIMSVNLLLEHDTDPVVWRGPLIAGTVKQFWTDVCWGGCELYVCGYAAGNRGCPADGFSVPSSGWDCCGDFPSGAGRHDCG